MNPNEQLALIQLTIDALNGNRENQFVVNRLFRKGLLTRNISDGTYRITEYGTKLLLALKSELMKSLVEGVNNESKDN